jgi:hypothetical protein
MAHAVVQRWDAFLEKTKTRATDLLAEASGQCMRSIAEVDCDSHTVFAGWRGVANRTRDLGRRVLDTWSEQVRAAMEAAAIAGDELEVERAKGDALSKWINLEIERTGVALRCELARENLRRDESESPSSLACTSCGAPIAVPIVFITTNVTCDHCRTINEYVPGTRRRMLWHHAVDDLPRMVVWPEYVVMVDAEHAHERSPSTDTKRTWEAAQLVHCRKFLCARVALLPEEVGAFEKDLREAIGDFYTGAIVVPEVTPLADLNDLRARMKKALEGGLTLVSTPMTSLTSSIFANARADLVHYGTVKTNVDHMACTVCGAPRIRDERNLVPCVYCGGALA